MDTFQSAHSQQHGPAAAAATSQAPQQAHSHSAQCQPAQQPPPPAVSHPPYAVTGRSEYYHNINSWGKEELYNCNGFSILEWERGNSSTFS